MTQLSLNNDKKYIKMNLKLKKCERKNMLKIISFIDFIYPQGLYNLNRFFGIFFVNLKKIKQALIAHVAKKRRNKSLIYPHR
jgi:hypothetical protein